MVHRLVSTRIGRIACAAVLASASLSLLLPITAVPPVHAQPYAPFAVPDSSLRDALRTGRAGFEAAWNALLVAELRASLAKADSAKRLAKLESTIADAEPAALGSRIGLDALALRKRWKKDPQRRRIAAAVAESLGTAARNARDHAAADSLFGAALASYQGLKEKRREAWVLGSLGANALVAGDFSTAAGYYDRALAARRALGDSVLLGNTLNDLGQTTMRMGQPERAMGYLREAIALRQAQRRWGPLGGSLEFLAQAQAALGSPDSAMASFRRALELISGTGDSARTLAVLSNFGVVLVDQGRTKDAFGVLERSVRIAHAVGNATGLATAEGNLGYLHRTAGRYSVAIEHFDVAIEQFEALGNRTEELLNRSRKGLALVGAGEIDRAQATLADARAIADSLGDPAMISRVASVQAFAASQGNDPARADALAGVALERAVAAGDSTAVHDAAAMLGYLAVTRGDAPAVERWLERAIGAGAALPLETRINDLTALATARQLAGRLDEAEHGHRAALAMADAHDLPNQSLWSRCCLGDVEERRGRWPQAIEEYGRAIAAAETLRTLQRTERTSISLFANRLFMFEAMIQLLGKLDAAHPDSGYGERAFGWAERARGRAFLDLVAASGSATAVRAQPNALLDLRGAQKLLRSEREALLEYSVGDSSTTLWVIRRDRWKRYSLPPRSQLQARVRGLRRALADPENADSKLTFRLSRGLYRQLIEPAEPMLAGVDRLIVSPDDALSLIPFEALLARDPAATGAAVPGSWLVDRYAISYTPSASVLATRGGGAAPRAVVAIGNPDFGVPDSGGIARALEPLPSTAVEIARLRTAAAGREIVTLTGREASREHLLALEALPRAGILHIATHGDVNESEPERSGLWLAPDAGETAPSRLEVSDILGMRLGAGLVTLSACETGLGRLESGEGVIGLSRAFLAAGAQSVVVSLWPVNDRSTAELMAAFYRRALDGRTPRDQALAAAKRSMLASGETRAPFYWAPFILVGRAGE